MFDITAFDTRTMSEKGVEMTIPHPRTGAPMLDSEGKPVTITVLGPNSVKSKAIFRTVSQRRADMAARNVTMTDEDFDDERVQVLVALTLGWSFDKMADQDFAFSPDNSRKFWSDGRWQWIANHAMRFVQQDGNFLPN